VAASALTRAAPAGLTALALLIAAGAAAAQGVGASEATPADVSKPAGSQAPARTLQSVDVVGAQPADDRRESTTTRIVVPHDEIVRYGDPTLADVLKRLPGITIEGVQGRGGAIRMRGLGNGYTQLLIDGEPAPPGFSLDSLAPDLVERIEILRAPTADMSAQAIAGTINIVLRKSVRKGQRSVKLTGGEIRWRPSFGVDSQLSDRAGAWSYSLAASVAGAQHYRPSFAEQRGTDASGDTNLSWQTLQRDARETLDVGLTPRVAWRAGDADTLTSESFFRYHVVKSRVEEDTTTLVGMPPTFHSDDLQFRFDTATARTRVDWTHRSSSGSTLDVKVGANYNRRDGDAVFHGFAGDRVFILDRDVRSAATDKALTAAGKYLTPIFGGHALALGWDSEYTQRDESRLQVDATPAGAPLAYIDENYRSRIERAALYAQDEWNITPRWSAYWGLRFEGLDTRTTGNVIRAVGNRSGVLSPVFQTLWKSQADKGDQVRLSLSRTYRAPTTRQLTPRRYIANNNTATTPDYQGNPDLHPELAWGIDAAYEHYFSDNGLVSLSAYARRIDDVILDRLVDVSGTFITFPANQGAARVHGVEAEAKVHLRDFSKAAPDVDIRANVTRNWSAVEDVPGPDNRLDRQVPLSANAGFDYTSDDYPLTVGASLSFHGGGPVRLSVNQSETLAIKRVLDIYALWRLDAATRIRLSVANVLRQDNVDAQSYFDPSGELRLTTTAATSTVVRVSVEFTL
jgi:outer membrane receptor for ferrienterochelin and colicins